MKSKQKIAAAAKTAAAASRTKTASKFFSPDDPLGSYTGVPQDRDEVPIQDADDL